MGLFNKLKGRKETVDCSTAHNATPKFDGKSDGIDESKFLPFYQAIANKLDEIVPEEWDEIVMYAEEFAGTATANFYYRQHKDEKYLSGGKIPDDYGVDTKTHLRLMQELIVNVKNFKKEYLRQNQQEWKALTFYLRNDFKFRVEYSYEINEEVDSYERQIYWAYETLGIEPTGDYGKTILNKYLESKRLNDK